MPLPSDEKLIALSEEILKQFEAMFGSHPGIQTGPCQGHFVEGDVYTFPGEKSLRAMNAE